MNTMTTYGNLSVYGDCEVPTRTMCEIIMETVRYYLQHPRSIDDEGKARYYFQGDMCAIGRCLEHPVAAENVTIMVNSVFRKNHNLKPEYSGHPLMFWQELQNFHDEENHWKEPEKGVEHKYPLVNDLTDNGVNELHRLLETWG
jgi:hypothetical protein